MVALRSPALQEEEVWGSWCAIWEVALCICVTVRQAGHEQRPGLYQQPAKSFYGALPGPDYPRECHCEMLMLCLALDCLQQLAPGVPGWSPGWYWSPVSATHIVLTPRCNVHSVYIWVHTEGTNTWIQPLWGLRGCLLQSGYHETFMMETEVSHAHDVDGTCATVAGFGRACVAGATSVWAPQPVLEHNHYLSITTSTWTQPLPEYHNQYLNTTTTWVSQPVLEHNHYLSITTSTWAPQPVLKHHSWPPAR